MLPLRRGRNLFRAKSDVSKVTAECYDDEQCGTLTETVAGRKVAVAVVAAAVCRHCHTAGPLT